MKTPPGSYRNRPRRVHPVLSRHRAVSLASSCNAHLFKQTNNHTTRTREGGYNSRLLQRRVLETLFLGSLVWYDAKGPVQSRRSAHARARAGVHEYCKGQCTARLATAWWHIQCYSALPRGCALWIWLIRDKALPCTNAATCCIDVQTLNGRCQQHLRDKSARRVTPARDHAFRW